jgi:hypothetical protein
MKKIIIILTIFITLSCDTSNRKLLLINNCSNILYYRLLTDTVLFNELYIFKVLPYASVRPVFTSGGEGAWEYSINNMSKDSTLHIYFFKTDQLNDSIIKGRFYKRLDFKVRDLKQLHWVVFYNSR